MPSHDLVRRTRVDELTTRYAGFVNAADLTPEEQLVAIASLVPMALQVVDEARDTIERLRTQLEEKDTMLSSFTPPQVEDLVNHPPHYKRAGFEVIEIIEAFDLNFRLANVIKYVLRAESKGASLQDLKKARWYLDREIAKREQAEEELRNELHKSLAEGSGA